MINEDRKKLYDALSSEYDLGTYEEFERNIGDSVKRRKLYDAASADYDLGDYENYSQKIGPTHKESLDAFTAEHGSWLNDFEARDSAETNMSKAGMNSGIYVPSESAITGEERKRYLELHKQEEALKKAWFTSDEYLSMQGEKAVQLSNLRDQISKERLSHAQSNPVIVPEGVFQVNPYATRGGAADAEQTMFETAERIMNETIKLHNAPSKYENTGIANFFKGGKEKAADPELWTAGLSEIADNLNVREVLASVQNKLGNLNDLSEEAIEDILSPAEKAVLQAWAINAQTQLERAEDLSRGYQAGQGAVESLGFMAEFALTGGVGKAATEGTEAMAKWLGKKALTRFGGMTDEVAEKAVKEFGEKVANNMVGKYAKNLGLSLAEAAGRTAVMPSTFRNISEKATEIKTDENGNNYLVSMNDAFAKGIADSFIENLSEGGRVSALGELVGDVAGKIPAYAKLVDKFSHTKVGELYDALQGSGIMNTLRAGGWHGLGEEYLEEWYGNTLRTLTGVDRDALKEFATVDNQIVTISSFLPMTIFGGTVSTAQVLSANKDLTKKAEALKSALMERGYDEDQANNMIDMMRGATPAEVSQTLTPIVNAVAGKNVNEAAALMKPVGEFANALIRWQSFGTKYNYQEQDQRDALFNDMDATLGKFWQESEDGQRRVQRGVNAKGEIAYLLGKPSAEDPAATIAAVNASGEHIFVNPSDYQLEDELDMNDFLGNEIMADKRNKEQARMVEEREAKVAQIKQQVAPGLPLNIGTEEAPVQAVVMQVTADGAIVTTGDQQARLLTWDELGNVVGINAKPMTDDQLDEAESDVILAQRDQRSAELDEEFGNVDQADAEVAEAEADVEAMQETATPLPTKADGSVDQTALWNADPVRWAKWNDEQRQDGGANSLGYINGAIAKESAALVEMQAAYEAESDFDARDAMEAEINKKKDRLDQLTTLQAQYVAAQQAAAAPAVETAPAQEEAVAPRVSQQMSEEEKAQMDAQHQARLEKAKSTAAKREAMQAYVNEISQGSVPMTLISMDGYEQVMKDAGCTEQQIDQVRRALKVAKLMRMDIPAFFVPRVGIFAFIENIPNIEQLRLTYVHERQHRFTSQDNRFLNAILSLGLSRERLAELVYKLSNSEFYADKDAQTLADEIISYAMERAYTSEDFSVALQELGVEQEIIDIITEIDNEQRQDYTTHSSRRGRRSDLHDNTGRPQNGTEADRNSEAVSGGLLGQQGNRPSGDSNGGNLGGRQTGEGAEVISEEQLDAPFSGDPSQITAADGEVVADTNGKGGVRFSIRTWREGGRDYLAAWLDNDKTLTDEEKADILARMDEFYENAQKYTDTYAPFGTWSEAAVRYDNNGNPLMSVIKANGDYAMNLDFSLVCKKRRPLNRLLRTLINRNAFGTYSLKEREIAEINWILQEHGFEVACALCFVDSKRYRVTGVADVFAALYNKLVKTLAPAGAAIAHFNYSNNPNVEVVENGIDTLADDQLNWEAFERYAAGFKEGSVESKVAQLLRENPSQRRLVDATDFIEAEGFEAVKANNQELLKLYNSKKGTGGPKASFGDVQYLNDILKKEKNFDVAKAYAVGGVRIQSFSDFVPHMYFDYMQLFAELAAKKLPAHAYTKEVLFAKIFGLTGLKINLSLVPAVVEGGIAPGLDAEGNYAWADAVRDTEGNIIQQAQSFPFDEAMAIQNAEGYSKNCGAIAVGISDEHIEKMLDDPNIQFIIPYHKSSLNAIVARMTNIDQYKDYTNVQTTKKASGTKLDKGTKDFNFNEYLHNLGESGTPQQAAQAYLDWCKENNFRPKFSQFAYHPNYYKLLVDFNTIDTTTGAYTPQGAVTMTFPTEQNAFGNVETLIEQGLGEDAQLEEKMEAEIDQIADEVESRLAEIAQEPKLSEKQQLKRMAELADERAAQIKARAEGTIDLVSEAEKAFENDVMMRVIGEQAAQRLDNSRKANVMMGALETAKQMADAGKDAKAIKMATGWEKAADGLWRYEQPDFEMKAKHGRQKTFQLKRLISDKSLFTEYPILNDVKVVYMQLPAGERGRVVHVNGKPEIQVSIDAYKEQNPIISKAIYDFTKKHADIAQTLGETRDMGSLTPEQKKVVMDELGKLFLTNQPFTDKVGGKDILVHEIQHIIQAEEGFALGGNENMLDTTDPKVRAMVDYFIKEAEAAEQEMQRLRDEARDLAHRAAEARRVGDKVTERAIHARASQMNSEYTQQQNRIVYLEDKLSRVRRLGLEGYKKLAGEVEARNVADRIYLSEEERRNTLLSETEDVAREDQIFLRNNVMMKADEYQQASVRFRITPEQDKAYMDAVNAGDMETAQKMVDAAARAAGYDSPKLYHGTQSFGFTKIDTSKSDDRMSFFATESPAIARSYSSVDGERLISSAPSKEEIKKAAQEWGEAAEEALLEYSQRLYARLNQDQEIDADEFMLDLTDRVYSIEARVEEGELSLGAAVYEIYDVFDAILNKYYSKQKYDSIQKFLDEKPAVWEERIDVARAYFDYFNKLINGGAYGNYSFYANTWGMLEVECNGSNWNDIKSGDLPDRDYSTTIMGKPWKTRGVAKYAKEEGYKGVIFKNIVDPGGRAHVDKKDRLATIYDFFDPQLQVKSADPVTYDEAGKIIPLSERFNPENGDIRFRFTPRTDEQREQLFDKAKAHYGLTNNFNASGYMLPDGSLLDFSEANDGGDPNRRSLDHRDIEGLIMDEGKEYDSRYHYVVDFVDEGAIRMLPEAAGFQLSVAPTAEQRSKLMDYIYKHNGEVIMEITDENGSPRVYMEYNRRTSPSRIFSDMDRFFNEGVVPGIPPLRFRVLDTTKAELKEKPIKLNGMYRFKLKSAFKGVMDNGGSYPYIKVQLEEVPEDYSGEKITFNGILEGFAVVRIPKGLITEGEKENEFFIDPKAIENELWDVLRATENYYEFKHGGAPYQRDWMNAEEVRFRMSNENQEIFVSNAAKAVEGIKQEKATPEQWLKMIEKAGGLKAGEDKWMGLSDFLKSSDKKTLTKQEVLDFINENMIIIEEQHYEEDVLDEEALWYKYEESEEGMDAINYQMQLDAEAYAERELADSDLEGEEWEQEYERLVSDYIEDDLFGSARSAAKDAVRDLWMEEEAPKLMKGASREINSTRINYTTEGLDNLHEIALTVPTIESWNESDDIHFGDAGDGRAVAWIRFGETALTEVVKKDYQPKNEIEQQIKDYIEWCMKDGESLDDCIGYAYNQMDADPEGTLGWTDEAVASVAKGMRGENTTRVLVIDEIQSKRHQEGREKGYKPKDYWPLRTKYLTTKTVYDSFYGDMEGKYGEAFSEASTEEDFRKVMSESDFSQMLRIKGDFERASNAYIPYRNSVPDAPFEKNWHELAMKRMLRYAAENGYDVIAWTKGEQQNQRYGLSKVVDEIYVAGDFASTKSEESSFRMILKNGNDNHVGVNKKTGIVTFYNENPQAIGRPLSDLLGKELADKILAAKDYQTFRGVDLELSEGMKGFYDKMLPAFMNKYGKRWGVKVEDIELPKLEDGLTMHSVPVTEEMKASVMEGQVMFRTAQNPLDAPLTAEERAKINEFFPGFSEINTDIRTSMNSLGQELTPSQQTFFANSKAVDKDGNLLVLYHGTPRAGFTEFKSGWFTTSKEDAVSYSGDRKGRLFDPNEKYEPETLTAGDFRLGYMTFDSEEDRAAFLERFPYAAEVISEREYEDARMGAEDEEYDVLTARREEFAEVWNAYREYERERFVDTTIGYLVANPEAYTEEDFMRAMLEYDSNASLDSLDDMDAAERKDALVSALQNANEETDGGIFDMVVPTRVPRNGEGVKHNDLGNRTYEVYANVENPYEIDANGRGSEFESGDIYKAVEEALADEQYDGVIVRNWRVGRTQQLGDVVVPKDGSQIKLTSNENPSESSDIQFRITEGGEESDIRFSIRTKPAPEHVETAYKLFNVDENGNPHALFIDGANALESGVWYDADSPLVKDLEKLEPGFTYLVDKDGNAIQKQYKNKQKSPSKAEVEEATANGSRYILVGQYANGKKSYHNWGINGSGQVSKFAMRPGWHLTDSPSARHIGEERNPEKKEEAMYRRPNQRWFKVEYAADVDYNEEAASNPTKDIQTHIPEDGYYSFKTNTNANDVNQNWIISGSIRILDPLSREEVTRLNSENGVPDDLDYREEPSFRITGTPTDEVVANGLQLTPAQTAEVAANIFAALPEESRKKITDGLNGNLLGLQDAILQIPTSLATKENWNDEDKEMADVVAEQMTKAVGKEMTRPFSAPEALWTLYNAVNKATDLVSEASRALVRRNLGFGPETLEMENQAREDVRFRTVNNASLNASTNMYNKGARNARTRLKESFVDMNASVEEFVKAIEKASGKVAQGFENILLALNQQSSKGLAAMESYEQKFLKPMFDAIIDIMKRTGAKYETVVRYVILKHGLERNKKLAQRDAKAHYQEIYDDIIAKIKSMTDAQKRTYLTNAQLQEADAKAELARLKAIDQSTLSDEDKKNLKKEIKKAAKAVAEAEELLKKAKKVQSMSEQDALDELQKIFDKIENGSDSYYQELRENDYSGLTSMFYSQLGVDRKDYETEEEYQEAIMAAKQDKYSTLADVEAAAEAEVADFENLTSTDELWKRINAATKETLRQQYQANMISKDQYESLRDMFEFYVPLRGFADNTAEDMYTYYRKPNTSGYTKPILGAEGRKTEAESPFGWIAAMAGSAIASNVKNEAKLALYYFVSNRPDNGIATISRTWFVQTGVDADGRKIFMPAYPEFDESLSSEEAKQKLEDWQDHMRELRDQGQAYESGQRLNLGNTVVNIDDKNKPEHIVTVKVAGKDYTIIINGNPRAAQAINGDLNVETDSDYQSIFGPVLRWMSSVNTSYNPEFWATNMMRDMAFTFMSVNIKEDSAYRRKFAKNYTKAFKVIKMVYQNEKGTIGDSYLEDMYKEFVANGGVTGYTQIKDSETWENEIKKYMESNNSEEKLMGIAGKKMMNGLHYLHQFGESLEQVSRFAAFLTAREMGKSMNEAINDAKEITVNFNRKGSGKRITLEEARHLTNGKGQPLNKFQQWLVSGLSYISPFGRRFFMFFNASIQGLNATYKLWKKNKTRAIGWALGYAAVGMMNALIHALMDDDDDYLDIPQYERRNSLMLGGNGVYFKWALPQEARAFYALGDLAVETVMGRNPHQNAVAEAAKIMTEILPVNPAEGRKAFIPSAILPGVELLMNEDYKGAPIYNEQKWLSKEEEERTARWAKAYQGTGKLYIGIAKVLNNITGGNEYNAGLVNLQPEKIEHIVQSAFGGTIRTADKFVNTVMAAFDPEEDVTARQFPFLNRFLTINDERFKNVHVNDVYDYYAAEAEHAITLGKKYTKAKDKEAYDKLLRSDEYKWAQIYTKYKKPIKKYQDAIKVADTTAERMELMKQQDELKKRMIKEISEL